jgi:hypothetical protein
MKKMRSWNTMSIIGAMGTSTFASAADSRFALGMTILFPAPVHG